MRWLLVVWVLSFAGASLFLGARLLRLARERFADAQPLAASEQFSPRGRQYVVDDRVGWRPRANVTVGNPIESLDGRVRRSFLRHHNNWGLIETDDFAGPPSKPAVLLLGDSHLMGIVSNEENASQLLQRFLRERPGRGSATVVNAASGNYSLYQYYLRARSLGDRIDPNLFLVVVFAGNDFYELEDPTRPHLDDQRSEAPAGTGASPEQTRQRLARLRVPARNVELIHQGLNQASYLESRPERFPVVLAKAARAAELLGALAAEQGARCLFVLLPSFDMVFPEQARLLGPEVAALVAAQWNPRLHDAFLAELAARGLDAMTVLPAFLDHRDRLLYAGDYHIWQDGHAVLEAAIRERVASLLAPR